LTVVNARWVSCLYHIRITTVRDVLPRQRNRFQSLNSQETIMNHLIRAGAITVAIFTSTGFAAAQTSGSARPDLTASQERMVSQGLANSPSRPAPVGAQPQVGSKVPDSMTAQALPNNVTDQVPEAKNLLFVKLPDRVLLIDPDSKLVTEIVDTTTGSNTTGSNPNSSSTPSR
jgi:hypothetical protein